MRYHLADLWLLSELRIRCNIYTCNGEKIKRSIAMKKILALILLAGGSLAVFAVLLIINFVVLMSISFTTVTLAVFISMAVAFGMAGFYKKLHIGFCINALVFWTFAYAPELIIGVGTLLCEYYQSFRYIFLGAGALLIFYLIPISGIAYAVWGVIFTAASWSKLRSDTQ